MKKTFFVITIIALLAGSVIAGNTTKGADETAIKQATMDYLEGWYEGNAQRMDKALHEKLAKRNLRLKPDSQEEIFTHLTKEKMVEYTGKGGGKKIPVEKRSIKITILDRYRNTASVKAESLLFIDYVHLVKTMGEWKIINVLWENIPRSPKTR